MTINNAEKHTVTVQALAESADSENFQATDNRSLGLYIHIPFCMQKCSYCGFFSAPAGDREKAEYVDKLLADIEYYGLRYGKKCGMRECFDAGKNPDSDTNSDRLQKLNPLSGGPKRRESFARIADTVFIGGGTPTILEAEQMTRILTAVRENFYVTDDAEITIESNPKTLTKEKLLAYRKCGVNRISIGVQSLDDSCLKKLGRVHSASDFVESYQLARKCGFDNINVDLMFAIPGQTMKIWENTLSELIKMEPEHISFYSLQIEEGTPFFESFMAGEFDEISDEEDRRMYHRAIEMLKAAGYEHYEISNACKPGRACRHNLKYWSMNEYLGIGASASSYVDGVRFGQSPSDEYHVNCTADDMSEFVFTGLRKICGISLGEFENRFRRSFWNVYSGEIEKINEYIHDGFLILDGDKLRLSEKGIDISNTIMMIFV